MLARVLTLILLTKVAFTYCTEAQMLNSQGKIIVGAIVIGKDTLPHSYLPMITIQDKRLLAMNPQQRKRYLRKRKRNKIRYSKLKRNVYKTYPYAVMAGFVIGDIDSAMLIIRSKDAQKNYKRRKEKELTAQYKGKLENLTMSQGRVLVILIARQTGKDCYSIIKNLKGGFNARMWQTLASLFSNNLKRKYEPSGKDAMLEFICQEIESTGSYVRTSN